MNGVQVIFFCLLLFFHWNHSDLSFASLSWWWVVFVFLSIKSSAVYRSTLLTVFFIFGAFALAAFTNQPKMRLIDHMTNRIGCTRKIRMSPYRPLILMSCIFIPYVLCLCMIFLILYVQYIRWMFLKSSSFFLFVLFVDSCSH